MSVNPTLTNKQVQIANYIEIRFGSMWRILTSSIDSNTRMYTRILHESKPREMCCRVHRATEYGDSKCRDLTVQLTLGPSFGNTTTTQTEEEEIMAGLFRGKILVDLWQVSDTDFMVNEASLLEKYLPDLKHEGKTMKRRDGGTFLAVKWEILRDSGILLVRRIGDPVKTYVRPDLINYFSDIYPEDLNPIQTSMFP